MLSQEMEPHLFSSTPEVLGQIGEEGVNLTVWERMPNRVCGAAIVGLMDAGTAPVSLDLAAPDEQRVAGLIGALVPRNTPQLSVSALASDVCRLSEMFGEIAGVLHPRVRLERVSDDGCALFHADTLTFRLLCTYAGAGTEWLENKNVRREQLGTQGRSLAAANAAIVRNPAEIRGLAPWHVAVLAGRLAPKNHREADNALVHRSAPISNPQDSRLRLCVDVACDC